MINEHGGKMPDAVGIPEEQLRKAAKSAVCKINIDSDGRLAMTAAVRKVFDLRPAAIIDELDLKRPIYLKTAAYGHFGRTDVEFPWEKTNKVEELKAAIAGE